MTKPQQAVLKTLGYADIFDYPLTLREIQKWLINEKLGKRSIGSELQQLRSRESGTSSEPLIQRTKTYYHLKGRQETVTLRLKRQRFSQLKLKKAQKIANFLRFIPSIKLIAVTGALAMNNSDENDDIDLMIITKKNRLWLTRLIVTLAIFSHLRRGHKIKNKICLNLWLDETALAIPKSHQNLYTAHEVCQIKPLLNRDKIYQKFITANLWYKNYLPNAMPQASRSVLEAQLRGRTLKGSRNFSFLRILNSFSFKLQSWYMKKKITSEKVNRHVAFFHPRPTGNIILKAYQKRLKNLTIRSRP